MGLLDKLLGRKQAEGDLTGSDSSQPAGAQPEAGAAVEDAPEPSAEPEAGV